LVGGGHEGVAGGESVGDARKSRASTAYALAPQGDNAYILLMKLAKVKPEKRHKAGENGR
jgi:hypothetical protein